MIINSLRLQSKSYNKPYNSCVYFGMATKNKEDTKASLSSQNYNDLRKKTCKKIASFIVNTIIIAGLAYIGAKCLSKVSPKFKKQFNNFENWVTKKYNNYKKSLDQHTSLNDVNDRYYSWLDESNEINHKHYPLLDKSDEMNDFNE